MTNYTASSPVKTACGRTALAARIVDKYFSTDRDDRFRQVLQDFIDDMSVAVASQHPEGRMLALVGGSGAGKTLTMEKAIKHVNGLDDSNFLRLTTPSPCTLKQLGRVVLERLGYPLQRELADHRIWEMIRYHLKEHGVRFIWLDEAHHILGRGSDSELTKLRDVLKSTMQQREWAVSLILSGLPVLSAFISGDRQVERRSQTFRFQPLAFPDDVDLVREIAYEIVANHAGMAIHDEIGTDEFIHRLIVASEWGLGSAITLVRRAVLFAHSQAGADAVVGVEHFAEIYAEERDCSADSNIFFAADWQEIVPSNSRLDAALPARPKRKRGKTA
ncbi:AAA family ATPase [Niveispirillum fermenti]|uniref:ATP-binding protein n=1 Tax=Niveispirillum fermenti TaxID=1233113 RepID=UPI003A8370B2